VIANQMLRFNLSAWPHAQAYEPHTQAPTTRRPITRTWMSGASGHHGQVSQMLRFVQGCTHRPQAKPTHDHSPDGQVQP